VKGHRVKLIQGPPIHTAGPHAPNNMGSFVLMVAGELPGDPEVELAYSLEDVFGSCARCRNRSAAAFSLAFSGDDVKKNQKQSDPSHPREWARVGLA
jgi:hypothetical protein